MFDQICSMGLFHCQHLSRSPAQIAITAITLGQCHRVTTFQVLAVQLLVGFVDEHQAFFAQTKAAPAIFVDSATHADTIWGKTMGLTFTPVPDSAGTIARAEFVPE
ncbi:hypothetical protein D3C77_590570 [compost metagenome]